MIARLAPSGPVILCGMEPGIGERSKATIRLYDLTDPQEITHRSIVDLTYSFLGPSQDPSKIGKLLVNKN